MKHEAGMTSVRVERREDWEAVRLVDEAALGLKGCLRSGFPLVVVLGSPRYYSRFGFSQLRYRLS